MKINDLLSAWSYRRLLWITLGVVVSRYAQAQDSTLLSLERIFSSDEFAPEHFGPAKWIDDGAGYTTLEPSATANGQDIVRYSTATGEREILVSAQVLVPPGDNQALAIQDYEWSPDKQQLLIFTNTQRVWRYNTRGDYWVLDVRAGTLNKLGSDLPVSSLMFAKFSPQSDRVAYVSEHNLYVEDLATGTVTALTQDGTEDIINGTFDWAYEEEFGARDGFRWSSDGQQIAYWQLDASGIQDFLMLNTTDSIYSYTIPVQYPKVGQNNSATKVGVVPATGGKTTWMQVAGSTSDNYLPRLRWSPDSRGIYIQRLNRLQNTNQVVVGNATSGSTDVVYTDRDDAWVEVVDDWEWLDEGQRFTWISEKDGWQRVYTIDPDTGKEACITPGEYDVISIAGRDEQEQWLYFIASPDNATQRYLYRSPLTGKGEAERLTPTDQPGTHRYQVAPDARWAIHTYSAAGVPPVTDVVSLPDHQSTNVLIENQALKEKVAALKKTPMEFFQVTTNEGVTMDAYLMKPYDFDSTRQYPVLFHVYGEPAGQTVLDQWGGSNYLWHLMLTQRGYVVMSMDNRGTPAPKGRAWRKSVYGQIGILASQDQAAGVQKIIDTYDFVDPERIGVWGWSGGGSMTLNAMFRYPDLYKTGIAVAPVANQLLYDNIYQERYMGVPWENEEGYRLGSPVTYAKNLKGNLLLIHGTGDDNVHYQNSEVLINELVRHNKLFSLMSYPNRSHSISEGENTSRHLRETVTHYLLDHLPVNSKSNP